MNAAPGSGFGFLWKPPPGDDCPPSPDRPQAGRGVGEVLVIGYGNTLRSDDGVGPHVAEAVARLNLPGVRVLVDQQLSPEHAEAVARARLVIFVDAAIDAPDQVQWRRLEPGDSLQLLAHAADPRTVLALARDVFGQAPEAWWLTIPIRELGFGETLSPKAAQGAAEAVTLIQLHLTV